MDRPPLITQKPLRYVWNDRTKDGCQNPLRCHTVDIELEYSPTCLEAVLKEGSHSPNGSERLLLIARTPVMDKYPETKLLKSRSGKKRRRE